MAPKSLCILPWVHARMNQDGRVMPCCQMNDYVYGKTSDGPLSETWNSESAKKLRRDFLDGAKPKDCSNCYSTEEFGGESLRQMMNRLYADEFDRLDRTEADGSVLRDAIVYLDLRFSNLCNFKCRSCSPINSVAWAPDAEAMSGVPYDRKILRPNGSAEAVLGLLEPLIPKLRTIYFAGGEPLMEDAHYLLLERLIELKKTGIHLDYNTNFSLLSWKKWNVTELWRNFDSVRIGASLDGVREQGELLRKGMDWAKTTANFHELKKSAPNVRFTVYMTVSLLNAFHVPDAVETFIENGMVQAPCDFKLNVTTSPDYIHLGILNEAERTELRVKYRRFLDSLDRRVPSDLSRHIRSELALVLAHLSAEFAPESRKKFRYYTLALDRIRKEQTAAHFPELLSLLYDTH